MGDDRVVIRSGNCDKMAEDDENEEEKIMGEERKEGHSCIEQMVLEVPPQEPEAINRSRNGLFDLLLSLFVSLSQMSRKRIASI